MTPLRFLLPSLLGVLIFFTPLPWDGRTTIGIGIVTDAIKALMFGYGLHLVIVLMVTTSVLTVLGTTVRVGWIHARAGLKDLFVVSPVWYALRLAGAGFGLIYFFQVGPALLQSEAVGGAVFVGIAVNVLAVYIGACLLLPLLTEFGLMEFVGTLARRLFRRVFRLPGRAAVDVATSFIGASAIGLLISIGQYERGKYTGREACVIATNFSVVSLPFSLVVASVSGIEAWFIPWYGVVIVACLLAALITPRLPPLSIKPDTFLDADSDAAVMDATASAIHTSEETVDHSTSLLKEAWRSALLRARDAPNARGFFSEGLTNLMFFLFSVVTPAMALAVVATLFVFHTPVFAWLGAPLVPLLEWAQLPEAIAAAPALFSGFLDLYMPAITAGSIDSSVTSFVLAGLSVCQLIFMSEVGVIILRSSLPLTVLDLLVIFLLRTVIVLPVLVLGAHLVVG